MCERRCHSSYRKRRRWRSYRRERPSRVCHAQDAAVEGIDLIGTVGADPVIVAVGAAPLGRLSQHVWLPRAGPTCCLHQLYDTLLLHEITDRHLGK